MTGKEIPRQEWPAFFDRFGEQHAGWAATVEVATPEGHSLATAHGLPLAGVAARLDTAAGDEVTLVLQLGPDEYVTHTAVRLLRVTWLEATEQSPPTIRLDALSGGVTCVEVRPRT